MAANDPDVLIVGGGPAGMMAGFLFARAGVRTCVLEKHRDFLRDFRGDTVHPSTLDLFDELGLLDRLLELPHDKVRDVEAVVGGERFRVADFSHLPGRGKFIAMMPQWHFLDFIASEARKLPAFALRMECAATGVVEEKGRIAGVTTADGKTLRARLIIAADGRRSVLREAGALPLQDLGARARIAQPAHRSAGLPEIVVGGTVATAIAGADLGTRRAPRTYTIASGLNFAAFARAGAHASHNQGNFDRESDELLSVDNVISTRAPEPAYPVRAWRPLAARSIYRSPAGQARVTGSV
ncbi:FAD-dependent monooxygenase [Sphingomonas sp. MMS24-J13]|uniref:FAD-dependent monooxygenase n=1 Tax=Sphingomonas sp. MMS24-J13 TaxID=3238686 RepID=UPI00384B4454